MALKQQLTSIKTLLLEISNDRQWNNLRNELKQYENYLKQQLQHSTNTNSNPNNNGTRPTKPPLRKIKANSTPNEAEDENENETNQHNRNINNKRKPLPTKPPMRRKQLESNKNNALLQLFIRAPNNKNNPQTMQIVIWNGDDNEIQQIINKLCYKNNQLQQYKNDIKNTILDLLK
eukprot:278876_1